MCGKVTHAHCIHLSSITAAAVKKGLEFHSSRKMKSIYSGISLKQLEKRIWNERGWGGNQWFIPI